MSLGAVRAIGVGLIVTGCVILAALWLWAGPP
jgi:hypothetical protein